MKIFYSWQSDTPAKIGKIFVRDALDLALKKVETSLDLDEAERPSIDQDTQGVMGSPAIAETIFEKIRNSEVVVTDVTLVGSVDNGKKLINSNVGIELGFAQGHHGHCVILSVMNTHYGSPEDLPFDLQHRRWPVCFELSPGAAKETRKKAREDLAKKFAAILGKYIQRKGQRTIEKNERIPFTDNPAMYWNSDEYLIDEALSIEGYDDPMQLGYTNDQPMIYMRVWPEASLEELTGKELNDLRSKEFFPLLKRISESCFERNKYGVIRYYGRNAGYLMATTQIFKNREIWGIDAYLLSASKRNTKYDFDFVPTGALETGIIQSLRNYLKIASELGYPNSVHVETGMVNVEGFKLALPNNSWEKFSGPIFEDVSIETVVDQEDDSSFDLAVSKIMAKVYDSAGLEQPSRQAS